MKKTASFSLCHGVVLLAFKLLYSMLSVKLRGYGNHHFSCFEGDISGLLFCELYYLALCNLLRMNACRNALPNLRRSCFR